MQQPWWLLTLTLLLLCLPCDGRRNRGEAAARHAKASPVPPTPNDLAETDDEQDSAPSSPRAFNHTARRQAIASNDPENGRRHHHRNRGGSSLGFPSDLALLLRKYSSGGKDAAVASVKNHPALPLREARDEMLKSSKDALIVTKKNYLKKDWCKTEPLIQKIREEGCLTRTIVNRFCYGQCNSFFIPKNAKQDMELTAFKSCAFCKPKRYTWITITLNCPGRDPPVKRKKIQRVKQCRCITEILQ